MNKTELINTLAFDMGLKRAESKEIVEKVFALMGDALASGDDCTDSFLVA